MRGYDVCSSSLRVCQHTPFTHILIKIKKRCLTLEQTCSTPSVCLNLTWTHMMTQPALYIKSCYSHICLNMIVCHLCRACKRHVLPYTVFGWSNTSTHWEIVYLPAAACARPVWKVMLETQSNNTICCRVWAGGKSQFAAVWEQREEESDSAFVWGFVSTATLSWFCLW